MDFEHALLQSNFFLLVQMMLLGSLMVPSMFGRADIYGKAARTAATLVVTVGPVGILMYVLFEVSHLN